MVNGCSVSIVMEQKEQPLIIAGDPAIIIANQNSHLKGCETLTKSAKRDINSSTLQIDEKSIHLSKII